MPQTCNYWLPTLKCGFQLCGLASGLGFCQHAARTHMVVTPGLPAKQWMCCKQPLAWLPT